MWSSPCCVIVSLLCDRLHAVWSKTPPPPCCVVVSLLLPPPPSQSSVLRCCVIVSMLCDPRLHPLHAVWLFPCCSHPHPHNPLFCDRLPAALPPPPPTPTSSYVVIHCCVIPSPPLRPMWSSTAVFHSSPRRLCVSHQHMQALFLAVSALLLLLCVWFCCCCCT